MKAAEGAVMAGAAMSPGGAGEQPKQRWARRHGTRGSMDGAMGGGRRLGASAGWARKRPARASGAPPVMGRRMVELVLGDGLGIRETEGRRLIEVDFGLGRAPSGGHAGGPMWEVPRPPGGRRARVARS